MAQLEHIIRQPVGERKATPLLLLHGAWHGAWCYENWLDDFAAHGYETHAMSLPGHGSSSKDKPINLYRGSDYEAALAEIVDQIKPTPFVVAHSLGGWVLQRYLRRHRLPGAVLLASIPISGTLSFFIRFALKHPQSFLRVLLTLKTGYMVNTPALFADAFLSPQHADLGQRYLPLIVDDSLLVAIETIVPIPGADTVKTPLLVVAGELDTTFPLPGEQRTAAAYKTELVIISGQGHDLMIDSDWQTTAERIRLWLDRLENPAT